MRLERHHQRRLGLRDLILPPNGAVSGRRRKQCMDRKRSVKRQVAERERSGVKSAAHGPLKFRYRPIVHTRARPIFTFSVIALLTRYCLSPSHVSYVAYIC
jgi:hypothetical protein